MGKIHIPTATATATESTSTSTSSTAPAPGVKQVYTSGLSLFTLGQRLVHSEKKQIVNRANRVNLVTSCSHRGVKGR